MAKRRRAGVFEQITYIIKGAEASFVELLVTVGPWLAPLTPASMTYFHVVDTLGFAAVWGWTTAISVEILGLASGHTLAKFHLHNKKYRAKSDKVPVWPIVVTFGFYLAVVITINMAMDWGNSTWAERIAKLGLILLSVPAIIIVSIRAQHAKVLMEKDPFYRAEEPEQPKQEKVVANTNGNGRHNTMDSLRVWLDQNDLTAHDIGVDGAYTPGQVAEAISADPVTVRTGLHRLRKGG